MIEIRSQHVVVLCVGRPGEQDIAERHQSQNFVIVILKDKVQGNSVGQSVAE